MTKQDEECISNVFIGTLVVWGFICAVLALIAYAGYFTWNDRALFTPLRMDYVFPGRWVGHYAGKSTVWFFNEPGHPVTTGEEMKVMRAKEAEKECEKCKHLADSGWQNICYRVCQ